MRTIGVLGLLVGALSQAPSTVKGRVIDDLANPLDNALVEVTSPETGATQSARTNLRGEYTIRVDDPSPRIEIFVRRIGFRPARVALPVGGPDVVGNVQMLPVAPMVIL